MFTMFCFSTAALVTRQRPFVMLYVHGLFCSYMYFNLCLVMEFKPQHVPRTRSTIKCCLNYCHDYGSHPLSALRQHSLTSSSHSFGKMSPFTRRTNGRVYRNPRLILLWIPLRLMQQWLLSRICCVEPSDMQLSWDQSQKQ